MPLRLPSTSTLGHDLVAALTIACVALPLNLALAIASGVPASMGLVSGVIAGIVAASLGGARLQVTGPEAALVPTVAMIASVHGVRGVVVATCISGVLQIGLGLARAGSFARIVPPPVVRGFMAGIGLLILMSQLPVLVGLAPGNYGLPAPGWAHAALLGGCVIGFMVLSPRFGALLGLLAGTLLASRIAPEVALVGALPSAIPLPRIPSLVGVDWMSLLPMAVSLAFLASLGSMLSASALDDLVQDREPPSNHNRELIAQGVANLACGAFGGLPVMGAIVRSAMSVQAGAKTRAASAFHALMLLFALTFAAALVAIVPVPALAAILITVGVRLVNLKAVVKMWKAETTEGVVAVVTATLIATTHFFVGVGVGLALSLILWMKRVSNGKVAHFTPDPVAITTARALQSVGPVIGIEASGAFTFLCAGKLDAVVCRQGPWPAYTVLDMRRVSMLDDTCTYVLSNVLEALVVRGGQFCLVCDPESEIMPALSRAGVVRGSAFGLHTTPTEALFAIAHRHPTPERASGERARPSVPRPFSVIPVRSSSANT